MPRPGPRPYECVRRAWHSDRHQPIRGSLIQEIFRIVNEIHSPATRKNKEWQEKLPIVVLKAEEIMYSKANSEAEYVDVDTLWIRVNDAINTIIRRDENESTESGELLQPCIEASLHLGCPARRASRSQRNNSPRFYLNPEKNENLSSNVQGNYPTTSFLPSSSSNFLGSNKLNSVSPANHQMKFPLSPNNTSSPSVIHQHNKPSSYVRYSPSPCSVYPLYHGNQFQSEADRKSVIKNLTFCEEIAQDVTTQADNKCISETPLGNECDLSLRLGPQVVPFISAQNSWPQEVEDDGLGGTPEVGCKSSDLSTKTDKGFSFLPQANANHKLELTSKKSSNMAQNLTAEAPLRKRKVNVSLPSEDRQISWPLKFPFKQLNGSIRNAGP